MIESKGESRGPGGMAQSFAECTEMRHFGIKIQKNFSNPTPSTLDPPLIKSILFLRNASALRCVRWCVWMETTLEKWQVWSLRYFSRDWVVICIGIRLFDHPLPLGSGVIPFDDLRDFWRVSYRGWPGYISPNMVQKYPRKVKPPK